MAKLHSEIRIKAVNKIDNGNDSEGRGDRFAEGDIIFNSANGEFMKRNATAYDSANATASWDVVSSGGGGGGITSLSADTNPQLGGDLDGQAFDITTTGKILYANMYATEADLPSAVTYHGMFAHVHATGKGYFAHGGNWIPLQNEGGTDAAADARIAAANIEDLSNVAAGAADGQVLKWDQTAGEWQPANDNGGGGGASDKIEAGSGGALAKAQIGSNQVEFFTSAAHRWNITSAGHFIPETHNVFDIGSADKKVRDL